MSDSLRPHGLQPTRLLCPWDFPGKSTGVGVPLPSPGDLPDPGIEPRSPALQADALPSELKGLAVQGTLKSLLQHHSSKASILLHSAFFIVQISHPFMTIGKISLD